MFFLRFFFLACQDVFQGVKLSILSIARQGGLSCQLVLGQETYVLPFGMETGSQNEPDMPFLRWEPNCLVFEKQFSCLLNVEEASCTSREVKRS
jgi:hypothetical protein